MCLLKAIMRVYTYNKSTQHLTKRRITPTVILLSILLLTYSVKLTNPPKLPQTLVGAKSVAQPTNQPAATVSSKTLQPPIKGTELLALTNKVRSDVRLVPLSINAQLNASATAKCNDMVTRDYWAHNDPAGVEPWHFIDESGYKKILAGENLAYGFKDSSAVMRGWMKSPEHKAALLDVGYRDVGFAVCSSQNYIHNGPQTIVVQHFGRPL